MHALHRELEDKHKRAMTMYTSAIERYELMQKHADMMTKNYNNLKSRKIEEESSIHYNQEQVELLNLQLENKNNLCSNFDKVFIFAI